MVPTCLVRELVSPKQRVRNKTRGQVVLGLGFLPLLGKGGGWFFHPAVYKLIKMEQEAALDRCGLLYGKPPSLDLQDQESGLSCCIQ